VKCRCVQKKKQESPTQTLLDLSSIDWTYGFDCHLQRMATRSPAHLHAVRQEQTNLATTKGLEQVTRHVRVKGAAETTEGLRRAF
jgi:hypothetical protein